MWHRTGGLCQLHRGLRCAGHLRERPINEDDLNDPINVYGMTKSVNDFSARRYIDLYGLDLRGIRICTCLATGASPA